MPATVRACQNCPPLLTVREAAAYTRVSEGTVRRWVADRTLPVIRLGRTGCRGHIRIRRADLDAFLAAATVGGVGRPQPVPRGMASNVDAIPRSAYKHLKIDPAEKPKVLRF